MRHPISKTIAAAAMSFVLFAAVSAVDVPTVRHIASGWWNSPERLAALPENPQVHYEDGAFEYARAVAGLLPAAIARVEAIHGRRFAHPVTVGVYVSPEAFVAANGLGDRGAVGMTFLGHVVLSPVLFSTIQFSSWFREAGDNLSFSSSARRFPSMAAGVVVSRSSPTVKLFRSGSMRSRRVC